MRSVMSNAVGHNGISLDMLLLSLPVILPIITAMVNSLRQKLARLQQNWQHVALPVARPIPKMYNHTHNGPHVIRKHFIIRIPKKSDKDSP